MKIIFGQKNYLMKFVLIDAVDYNYRYLAHKNCRL